MFNITSSVAPLCGRSEHETETCQVCKCKQAQRIPARPGSFHSFQCYLCGTTQARSQVSRFDGVKDIFWGGRFCFQYTFKTNVSVHNRIWGHKKIRNGALAPNALRDYGLATTLLKLFPISRSGHVRRYAVSYPTSFKLFTKTDWTTFFGEMLCTFWLHPRHLMALLKMWMLS